MSGASQRTKSRVDRFCDDSLLVVDIEPHTTPGPAKRAVRRIKGILSQLPPTRRSTPVIFIHANPLRVARQVSPEWEATMVKMVRCILRSTHIAAPRAPLGLIDVSSPVGHRIMRRVKSSTLRQLLHAFPDPAKVRIFQSSEELRQQLPQITEALRLPVRHPALGDVKAGNAPIVKIGRGLGRSEGATTPEVRDDTGRLDASRIADVLGVSESQLAKALGRSRQALNKTPNAPSMQKKLGFLERVARAREAFQGEAGFRAWLRQPNRELRGKAPMDLLLAGRLALVAEFAEDFMDGNPA